MDSKVDSDKVNNEYDTVRCSGLLSSAFAYSSCISTTLDSYDVDQSQNHSTAANPQTPPPDHKAKEPSPTIRTVASGPADTPLRPVHDL